MRANAWELSLVCGKARTCRRHLANVVRAGASAVLAWEAKRLGVLAGRVASFA
jgi:hypothetical protein